jgi:hypothetical protein
VGPRAGLDHAEKRKFLPLPGLELQPLRRPARSQSLNRLCSPGSYIFGRYESKLNFSSSISCNTKFNENLFSSFRGEKFGRTQDTFTICVYLVHIIV